MVKVGIVGAGFMGKMHAACYEVLDGAQLIGVADKDVGKAEEISDKYKIKAYRSLKGLLEDPVDIVDICLPTYLHKEAVIESARAGKNVLCEKPIALSTDEATEMISESKKAGIKFMVAQAIRFWPEYAKLKEIFDDHPLGTLMSLSCRRFSPTPIWSWQNWMMDPEKSGSALIDLHIHDTDFILYLLGRPKSIFSKTSKTEIGHWHVWSIFEYPDKIAVAEGGWHFAGNFPFMMAFTAFFEKGVVEFNSREEKTLAIYDGENIEYPEIQSKKTETDENISELGGFYKEIKYFVECVERDRAPEVITPEEAKDSLELVLAELKSAESGEKILI